MNVSVCKLCPHSVQHRGERVVAASERVHIHRSLSGQDYLVEPLKFQGLQTYRDFELSFSLAVSCIP